VKSRNFLGILGLEVRTILKKVKGKAIPVTGREGL
jgi:hypothetical protein